MKSFAQSITKAHGGPAASRITAALRGGADRVKRRSISPTADSWLPLAGILLCGAAVRVWLLLHDVPTLNSDEAVIGLMGLHVLHGEWSLWYWGQEYMGSLEALLVAPFLAIFGVSYVTLHLATLLLSLAFIVASYALARILYSPGVALATAALLAVGSPFLIVVGLRTWGGYIETTLFGTVLLLFILRGVPPPERGWRRAFLFGVVAGLALYTDLLVLPYLLGCVLIAFWQRRTDLLRHDRLLALAGGVALIMAPVLVSNVSTGGGTLVQVLRLTNLGTGGPPSIEYWPRNLGLLFSTTMPVLAGADFGGLQGAGYWPEDYFAARASHPVAYGVGLSFAGIAMLLWGSALLITLRKWRMLRVPPPPDSHTPYARDERDAPDTRALLRKQGEAALALIGAGYLIAVCSVKDPELLVMPRYLLPLFGLMPLLVGRAQAVLAWLASSPSWGLCLGGHRTIGRAMQMIGTKASVLVLALVLAWNITSAAAVTALQTASRDHGVWIYGHDQELLALLRTHHVSTAISNDYWICLKMTFESEEQIIALMIAPDGRPGYNRYLPYLTRGLVDPRPAYLELTGTDEARKNLERLELGQLPGYQAYQVGAFTVLIAN